MSTFRRRTNALEFGGEIMLFDFWANKDLIKNPQLLTSWQKDNKTSRSTWTQMCSDCRGSVVRNLLKMSEMNSMSSIVMMMMMIVIGVFVPIHLISVSCPSISQPVGSAHRESGSVRGYNFRRRLFLCVSNLYVTVLYVLLYILWFYEFRSDAFLPICFSAMFRSICSVSVCSESMWSGSTCFDPMCSVLYVLFYMFWFYMFQVYVFCFYMF